jgi:hypothetical protein
VTTYFNFQPNRIAPFQFQPTLDGNLYSAAVTWNWFAQRWYLNLADQNQNLIFTLPVIGSADGIQIDNLVWSENGVVTVTAAVPHGFKVLSTFPLNYLGNVPIGYNGTFMSFVVDPVTLTFKNATNPGTPSIFGKLSYDINIAGGYFMTSSLVYRQSTGNFEVNP